MGTAQTKTISQRIAFNIVEKKGQFIDFLKNEFPDQKINKELIIKFYKILISNVDLFPKVNENKITKKDLIDHLDSNFLAYQEYYFDAINYF